MRARCAHLRSRTIVHAAIVHAQRSRFHPEVRNDDAGTRGHDDHPFRPRSPPPPGCRSPVWRLVRRTCRQRLVAGIPQCRRSGCNRSRAAGRQQCSNRTQCPNRPACFSSGIDPVISWRRRPDLNRGFAVRVRCLSPVLTPQPLSEIVRKATAFRLTRTTSGAREHADRDRKGTAADRRRIRLLAHYCHGHGTSAAAVVSLSC